MAEMGPLRGPEDWTLAALERARPWIDWREPLAVTAQDGRQHYACRICFARMGLHGRDVPRLPTNKDEARRHIAREHVQEAQP